MKLIISYVKRHLLMFLVSMGFLCLECVATLLLPSYMALIVDRGVKQADTGLILHYGMVMLLITLIGACGAAMRNIFACIVSQTVAKEMRLDLYRKIASLSLENIDQLSTGSLITRITNDVTKVQEFVSGCMRIMFKAPVTCIGAICLIVIETPEQIPMMLVVLAFAFLWIALNTIQGYPRFGTLQKKLDALNTKSRQFLSNIRVVKAFCAEDKEEARFDAASEEYAVAGTSANRINAIYGPLINLSVNFGIVFLLWRGSFSPDGHIGLLMASVNYMVQVLLALSMVSNIMNRTVRALTSAARIREVLETQPIQKEEENPRVFMLSGALACEDVSFSYAGTSNRVLNHVTFSIPKGTTLGIIGPTGSGKSTLVNLVPRLYDASKGVVSVDGMDVRKMNVTSLRQQVSVVMQKATLFTGTIRENLLWGNEDATDEDVEKACHIACADEFIDTMANGYGTLLGQGGVNLSGGQKQRLSIARALLRKPSILVLDDVTSALDAQTEATVLARLHEAFASTTVLLVTQRISTAMKADQILVLDNGEVKGFDTHEKLMRECATYQEIWKSQIGGGYHG